MDEVKITSRFTRRILSNIISKKITKAIGSDISLELDDLDATVDENGTVQAHLDICVAMSKDNLIRLLMKNKLM